MTNYATQQLTGYTTFGGPWLPTIPGFHVTAMDALIGGQAKGEEV